MRNQWFIFFLLWGSVVCRQGLGYPSYIGYGYASCQTCHFNPLGNGLIRQYGRAVQATEISGNLFGRDPETLGTHSAFILGPLPEELQLQMAYRGLWIDPDLQAHSGTRFIHMQAEGAGAILFSKKLMASGSIGYVPLPRNLSAAQQQSVSNVISREHYVGYTPQKGMGFYLGLMDIAFGLRVPDHNAYIRSTQFLNINDQTHGLLFHRDWDSGELGLHLFLGKLHQESTIRQKGVSLFSEFAMGENIRWGFSCLASGSNYRSRQMLASHGRFKIGEGSALLAELGIFRQTLSSSDNPKFGSFSLVQSRHKFLKGIFGLMTFEHFIENLKESSTRFLRAGPSLELLPFPQLEFRIDFLGTYSARENSQSSNSYLLQVQTHVWL